MEWIKSNHLLLNAIKTKEMIVDLRMGTRTQLTPITIQGTAVEVVSNHRYLGVQL